MSYLLFSHKKFSENMIPWIKAAALFVVRNSGKIPRVNVHGLDQLVKIDSNT